MRKLVLVLLALALAATPGHAAVAAKRIDTLGVTVLITSSEPHDWVLTTQALVGDRLQTTVHHPVAGVFMIPATKGKAFVRVAAQSADGGIGPWVRDVGVTDHHMLHWNPLEAATFQVGVEDTVVGPFAVTDPGYPIPESLEMEVGSAFSDGIAWRQSLGFPFVRLPVGSSIEASVYGCAADRPVFTGTRHASGDGGMEFWVKTKQLGRAPWAVYTLRRPGLEDVVRTSRFRPVKPADCDHAELLDDDVWGTNQGIDGNGPDTIDSHNGLPVWVRGQANHLPNSVIRRLSKPRAKRPRAGTMARGTGTKVRERLGVQVEHSWRVGRRRLSGDWARGPVLKLRPGMAGKRLRLVVTVDLFPEWEPLVKTVSFGKIGKARQSRR